MTVEGTRPVDWVTEAVERFGRAEVALRCAALLRGGEDPELLPFLAGRAIGLAKTGDGSWPRVWAARGLRYAWDDGAAPAVIDALADPAWRVREMAAKVVLHHEIGEGADAVATLGADPVPRVRAAAAGALAMIGEAEHAAVLHSLMDDPEPSVRRKAETSLRTLSRRIDREV